jgi:ABC-type dipeptide/oligopeptide/nickel transport system permease component
MENKKTYAIQLTEGEVQNLGANRFNKTRWKRYIISFFIGIAFVGLASFIGNSKVVQLTVGFIGVAFIAVPYYWVVFKAEKAGKLYLDDVKKGNVK